jgi:hypothetical protein
MSRLLETATRGSRPSSTVHEAPGRGTLVVVAKLSHGGVALYDSETDRLVQWLMMSSGTPTSAHLEGDEVAVNFADGHRCRYDAATGEPKR